MEIVLGTSVGVYVGVTVLSMGAAAYLTGQAVAFVWRPARQIAAYGFLLAFAARFFVFALFEGEFFAFPGIVVDYAILTGIAFAAHRLTHVAKTIRQYPWLYERSGLWSYRERPGASAG